MRVLKGGVFANCTQLFEITIPNNIESVIYGYYDLNYYGPFEYSGLKLVTIEEGVETIGNYMFSDCENLKYVDIPNTVIEIEKYAF